MNKERKQKFNDFCYDAKIWWQENKDWAQFAIPIGIGLATAVIKGGSNIASQAIKNHRAAEFYDKRIWDPNLQIHHTLKRAMSSLEKEDFAHLRSQGYSVSEALKILNLV